jgi:glucose-6-phosphate dehydrogenase assembly protein OpcA
MAAAVKLPLEAVEREIARLWEMEARRSGAPRMELMTLVVLVGDPSLVDRAEKVVAAFVRTHPSRTILARWATGAEAGITADVALHRLGAGGAACGDAITLEATGGGRDWLPDNVERLALADLPICLWWVGDLPDSDRLIDRMLGCANVVVVNSDEMDLRDLHKLSLIVTRSHDRYTLMDLAWVRLRPVQELIARFFDDEQARACLSALQRILIEFVPREHELDVASTQAGLLFGWVATALRLGVDVVRWQKGDAWAEATLGRIVWRFERHRRTDLPAGTVNRIAFECDGARFEIERQDDPSVYRWSRDVPGAVVPAQTLRMPILDEATLLARSLERPMRDPLFESTLHASSRLVRSVAPRLSAPPRDSEEP